MALKKCKIALEKDTVCCVTHGYHYREFIFGLSDLDLTNILLDKYNDHRSKKIAEAHE